mgnify:CR=1 FL=1
MISLDLVFVELLLAEYTIEERDTKERRKSLYDNEGPSTTSFVLCENHVSIATRRGIISGTIRRRDINVDHRSFVIRCSFSLELARLTLRKIRLKFD